MEIDFLAPTAQVAGQRLTLSYQSATPEDQAVIEEFGGRLNVPPLSRKNETPASSEWATHRGKACR